MKKIINKVFSICFIIFDVFVDFLFLIRLLIDLRHKQYDNYKIKNIKLLLQFLAISYSDSVFEFYNSQNDEYLFQFYYSLKNKNSEFFKGFCLVYSFLFRLSYLILGSLFGYSLVNKFAIKLNKKIDKQIENNFGYEYLREYRRYYRVNKKFYKQIRFEIFYKETKLNLSYWWNEHIIKNYKQSKLFINTDYLIEDIEQYF